MQYHVISSAGNASACAFLALVKVLSCSPLSFLDSDPNMKSKASCCNESCMKTPMYMFNLFYWMSGLFLVLLGAWTLVYKGEYNVLLGSSRFLIIVGLMIGMGGMIMIICMCGCYGSVREHRYLLISFLVMLTLIFVVELSVGIVAFVHRAKIRDELETTTMRRMNEYEGSEEVREALDLLQQRHKCCGDLSYVNWNATTWKRNPAHANVSVPDSCCITPSRNCGKRDHPSNIYHQGCLNRLDEFFKAHLLLLAGVASCLTAIQLIGIILTSCMLRFVDFY